MPVNIYDLATERKTVTLQLGGGAEVTVTYRPNNLTPAKELTIIRTAAQEAEDNADNDGDEQIEQAERNISRQITTFIDLVEAWDFEGPLARGQDGQRLDLPRELRGDDKLLEAQAYVESAGGDLLVQSGAPVPLTMECLKLLPSNFLMRLVALINQDMRPNPKTKRRSADT